MAASTQWDLPRAARLGLALWWSHGDQRGVGETLASLAGLALAAGEAERAAIRLGIAVA